MWLSVFFVFTFSSLMFYPTTLQDRNRELYFPGYYFFAERRLINHKIRTMDVKDLDDCELLCYRDDNCVSLNIKNKDNDRGTGMCELNNSTHLEHEGDLKSDSGFNYRGAKNACGKNRRQCENNGICQSGFTDKGYRCLCAPGFQGEHCEEAVKHKCSSSSHSCDVNAECGKAQDSYSCTCKAGYSGDGRTCSDVDECSTNYHSCDANAECSNTQGSYTCACQAGYSGDGRTCSDIEECSTNTHGCNAKAKCSNTQGSYTCACQAGYSGDGRSCSDKDECSSNSHGCDVNAVCENTDGSYTCTCDTGYSGDGTNCKDIDECYTNSHSCDANALCSNTPGSHTCACKARYSGDGRTCKDIDECSTNSHSCDVNAICNNIRGSYTCVCQVGYSGDGRNCSDIDECASGVDDCHTSASCNNTAGSYSCSCNDPFTGDGRTCSDSSSECENYEPLKDHNRKTTYRGGGRGRHLCDNLLGPGWFRFQGAAGTQMPTSCPPSHRCGTDAPGWLNGTHPTVAEGRVTRKVYFNRLQICSRSSINIQVRNCGSFYVYHLHGTPGGNCNLRYCSTD